MSELNQAFQQMEADFRLKPDGIILDTLKVGNDLQGFTGSGEMKLGISGIEEYVFRGQAQDLQVVNLHGLKAHMGGTIVLTGAPGVGQLTGQVVLSRGEIRLSDFLATLIDPESIWYTSPFLKALESNVQVSSEGQFWIRDDVFNVEITGDVDVIKTRDGTRVYGDLNSKRGQYALQDKSFQIERGRILFQGKPEVDPELDVLARVKKRIRTANSGAFENFEIRVLIGGTVLFPQVTLEAENLDNGNDSENYD